MNTRKTKNGTSVKQSSSSAARDASLSYPPQGITQSNYAPPSQRPGQQVEVSAGSSYAAGTQHGGGPQLSRKPGNPRGDQLPGRAEANASASLGASSSANPAYSSNSSQPASGRVGAGRSQQQAKERSLATDGTNQRRPGRDLTAVAEAPEESEDGTGSGPSRLRGARQQLGNNLDSPASSDDEDTSYNNNSSGLSKQPRGDPQRSRATPKRARGSN